MTIGMNRIESFFFCCVVTAASRAKFWSKGAVSPQSLLHSWQQFEAPEDHFNRAQVPLLASTFSRCVSKVAVCHSYRYDIVCIMCSLSFGQHILFPQFKQT